MIVGGHQRVRAAQELGHKAVPVVYVDLPPDDEKLLNLALNKIGGEFDLPKLAEILRDLRKAEADLESSGFSQREISRAIVDAERELAGSLPPDEDDVPDLPRKPRTQAGELVKLGPHRLLCGDSTKPEDLRRLMGEARADLLWTDPPYGVDYVGKTARAMTIRNDGRQGLEEFLRAAFAAVDGVLERGAPFYIAHPAGMPALPFVNAVRDALAREAEPGMGQGQHGPGALGLPLPARGDPVRLQARHGPPGARRKGLVRRRRSDIGVGDPTAQGVAGPSDHETRRSHRGVPAKL